MVNITNQELIDKAASVVKSKKVKDSLFADIGCALLSKKNNIYLGVCAASGSNTFCAEKAAIGAMITNGEYEIKEIVAVWKDDKGKVFVIPPRGNCRQLIRETEEKNLNTDVILDKNKTVKLKELLPYFDWWKEQE
ncbi:cytidine deaminase [Candidatus Pacearchaeota archaeon]|nr:cytidine deaminase [Candidatus Pacearchaeota archaeon]|tara:strand:+ start:830 stop:1237 length:408 start_codon:yes stop_codon:yes gene_type:complete